MRHRDETAHRQLAQLRLAALRDRAEVRKLTERGPSGWLIWLGVSAGGVLALAMWLGG